MTLQTKRHPDSVATGQTVEALARPPVQEWLDLVDAALHGIHHSLNNRIGSLLAVVDLHRSGGLAEVAGGLDGLASEVERLQECNRVVRLLPDSSAGEEALDVRDVLSDAMVIHELLPSTKELPVVLTAADATPVRAERWALLRALTLLLRSAKSAAQSGGAKAPSVHASIEADDAWVRVVFRFGGDVEVAVGGPASSRYVEMLAARFGGSTMVAAGAVELRIPTLKARRAAERR